MTGSPARQSPDANSEGTSGRIVRRLVSAAVLIAVAVAVVTLGGGVFAVFVAAAAAVMAWEWERMASGGRFHAPGWVLAAGLIACAGVSAFGYHGAGLVVGLAGALGAGALGFSAGRRDPWFLGGAVYLACAVAATLWLRGTPDGARAFFWLLFVVWCTDTGAYAAGRLIGGPVFAPRFSPNKTWAGVVGGLAAAAIVGVIASRIGFRPLALGIDHTVPVLPYTLVFALAVQAGDILESAAKRHFGAKDSSGLIPGHGGLLDRLDGYLLAVSIAALCALLHGMNGS